MAAFAIGGTTAFATAPAFGEADLRLWYPKPAAKWEEALPVGNGRLGAMVFGGVTEERIQFNEDTLWTGKPHDYARESALAHLPALRAAILSGNDAEAKRLGKAEFLGSPVRQKAYQPFGDIRLTFPLQDDYTDYRRELDLVRGIAVTTYRVGNTTFRREVFASYPAQAIVIRLTADKPGALNVDVKLTSPHKSVTPSPLGFEGEIEPGGLRFAAGLLVRTSGGTSTSLENAARFEGADEITLVLVATTSFRNFQDISADPVARRAKMLERFKTVRPEKLQADHLADHQRLFGATTFHLAGGSAELAAKPTDERQRALKTTGLAADPALAALYFNYGRYLLLASSRPGSQPANLQGVWNELLDPPWESKFTTNINLEMNYWPAEVANLGECHEPLFDLIDDLVVSGRRTARKQYGVGGWVLHHNTDLWRGTAPINNIDGIWPTGGAWLCWHLWERYRFTGDREFLAERAYPVMKEAAQFFVESLVEHPQHHWLVTLPSYSPEQGTLCAGPAMDTQLVRALFQSTIEAARILKTDAGFAAKVEAAAKRLPPDLIGKHGQLQEWLEDVDQTNNKHRHMSPLWALYPGDDFTPDNPKVFDAAKVLLKWRGDGSTGWSYAWRIPLWARVGDGDFALRQFAEQLQRRTLPNLFDLCGPFQIDGNFGATAGVAEMLLQSHRRVAAEGKMSDAPLIELLPALPKAWPEGAMRGLRARGGFEMDQTWSDGKLARVEIRSTLGGDCRLRYGERTIDLHTTKGSVHVFDGTLGAGR